jgi:hypothetical protein
MKNVKIFLLMLMLPFLTNAQTTASKDKAHAAANRHKKEIKKPVPANAPVRGVTVDYFKNSVTEFKDTANIVWADSAWMLWKKEQWAPLETFFTLHNLNGGWPPNRGATSLKVVSLTPGFVFDRYGGYYDADSVFQDKGTFVSQKDVPFAQRALPDKTLSSPHRVYKVVKEIPNVNEGGIIPWFGKEGLGIQYELPYNINDLKKEGYIEEVDKI